MNLYFEKNPMGFPVFFTSISPVWLELPAKIVPEEDMHKQLI